MTLKTQDVVNAAIMQNTHPTINLFSANSTQELKPFKVGDNDMVLAHDSDQALEILMATAGYSKEDVEDFAVDDLSTHLDMKLSDEDHNFITTLGHYISSLEKPQYLFGWE
jgi:hypothetical protein